MRHVYWLVFILVAACGDDPEIDFTASVMPVSTPEDTPASFAIEANLPATFQLTTAPTHGTVTGEGTAWTYTPEANYFGADALTITATEGATVIELPVPIAVTAVNDAPVAEPDSFATNADNALPIDVASLLANDSDLEGDTLSITAAASAVSGGVVLAGNTVTFTPTTGFAGMATFEYTLSDGTDTATGTVTVAVGVAQAITATDDTASTDEDVAFSIPVATLLGNDIDPDGHTLSITEVQNAVNCTVVKVGSEISVTPAPDANGQATFEYIATDGALTDTATVTITINPVADAPVANADTASTAEDTPIQISTATLLGNDTDADNDALTITSVTGTGATLASSTITFAPLANFNGDASFQYTISDGNGGTSTTTVTVTVTPVADAPVANGDAMTIAEDGVASVVVLANDSDADGDTLTVGSFTQPAHGVVNITGGVATYTPAGNFTGADAFTYTVDDGTGGTATGTVSITVTPVNDAPVAVDDSITVAEETATIIPAAANDADVDGDTLVVSVVTQPLHGTVQLVGGVVTYTPAVNYVGPDGFDYTVSDGNTGTDLGRVTINVTNVNDAPVANADVLGTDENTVVTGNVVTNDTDADGDTLTVQSNTQGAHGSVTFSGNVATYTPNTDFSGEDAFTYTISDGKGGTATGNVTVFVGLDNDPPVAVDDTATVVEETPTAINVLGNDSDIDLNPLVVSAVTSAEHGIVSLAGGVITYTPSDNYFGPDGFDYVVSDGLGGSDIGHVTITVTNVNDAPVAVNDTLTTNEDSLATLNVTLNDTDIDGDTLAIQSSTQPSHGTLVFTATLARYTPALNYNGPDSFTYTVTDGNGGTSTATVTITVNPVNDAPVAGNDARTVVEETATVFSTLLGNDNDVDGDVLSIAAVGTAAHGTLALNTANNTVTYTPATNYFGPDAFDYTISDGKGGVDIGRVNITVTNVNDAPVAVNDALSTDEDTPKALNVVTNDTDVDNDTLTLLSVAQPATGGSVTFTGNTVTFTPAENFNGNTSFTYVVRDPSNATSTGTVNVSVLAVNDAPVAGDDAITTNEDTAATNVNVRGNDTDVEGTALTITAVTQPANGTVANNGTTITFTPALNFNGETSFTYTVSDGQLTDTATVTVTVNPVNDPPVAVADTINTDEDTQSTSLDLAANDNDGDPEISQTLSIGSSTNPANGTLAFTGTSVRYTPNANFNGTDSFTYSISDGTLTSAPVTVAINVSPVNDAPDAVADTIVTNEDTAAINVDLRSNDDDGDAGVTQALSITAVTQPANGGSVTINGGGTSVTFTPAANFSGATSFTYTLSDGDLTDTATVGVTVNAVNDLPIANDDTFSVAEDSGATVLDVLANDSDVEGAVTVTSTTQPANGSVTLVNGVVSFTPAANFAGATTFSYTITDSNSATATATVTVDVTNANDPPIAIATTEIVAAGDTKTFTLTGADIEGQPLTFAVVTQPVAGTLGALTQLTPTSASVTYTAGFGASSDSFTFRVNDGTANSTAVTVSITIEGCGNGDPADGEECDDGNQTGNDGCEPSCTFTCGSNGVDIIPRSVEVDQTTGSCFARYDDLPSDYDQAIAECSAIGGHLATVTSLTEHEAVLKVVEGTEAWLGADDRIDESQFLWITGEDFTLFDGFADPPDVDQEQNCVATTEAGWLDADCGTPTAYICEFFDTIESSCGNGIREGQEECDDGPNGGGDGCEDSCKFSCASGLGAKAVEVDSETGSCFAFFAGDRTYDVAKELCIEKNGQLATGVSSPEPGAMFSAIRQAGVPGGAWVAAIRDPEGFVWETPDLDRVEGNFLNPNDPDSGTGDCLFANVLSSDGPQGWSDEKCEEPKAGTLCEYEINTDIELEANLLQPFAPGSAAAIMIENLRRHGTLTDPGR